MGKIVLMSRGLYPLGREGHAHDAPGFVTGLFDHQFKQSSRKQQPGQMS